MADAAEATPTGADAPKRKVATVVVDEEPNDELEDYDDEKLEEQRKAHVHSTEEKDAMLKINAADEVIELNSLRLFHIEEVDLDSLTGCTVLEMRKNLIHKLVVLPAKLREQLDTLDFFDNKIRFIGPYFSGCDSPAFTQSKLPFTRPDLLKANGGNGCHFTRLRKLDLSYNQISTISGLDDLAPTLEELYLVENRIKVIEGLDALTNLKLLELGGNQIRDCSKGLEKLVNLEQLWLGKNKIDTIGAGLVTLKSLRRLSLQANRLVAIPPEVFPAGAHPVLDEVYLSENGLPTVHGLDNIRSLVLLDMSFNPIKSLTLPEEAPAAGEGKPVAAEQQENTPSDALVKTMLTPSNFPILEEFWLTDGELASWPEIERVLGPLHATLRTVYLERNPLEKDKRYRDKVFTALPFVTQIDSWPVVNKGNLEADRAIRR